MIVGEALGEEIGHFLFAAASAFDFERYAVDETGLILSEDGQVYIGKIGAAPRQTMEALPGMLLE